MPKVMIVPETDEYALDASHSNTVWITKALGTPRFDEHDVTYLAPLWLKAPSGVTRIYHILGVKDIGHVTEISFGNSFVLPESWDAPGQRRRFECSDLSDFGFVEIKQGLLLHIGAPPNNSFKPMPLRGTA